MHFESGMRNMIHMGNGIMSGDKAYSIVLQTIIKHTYIAHVYRGGLSSNVTAFTTKYYSIRSEVHR